MIGLHFFNPVQLMKLVEVVRTSETDPAVRLERRERAAHTRQRVRSKSAAVRGWRTRQVFARAFAFSKSLGKTPVDCIDTPGFVVNRLLVPFLIEAICLVRLEAPNRTHASPPPRGAGAVQRVFRAWRAWRQRACACDTRQVERGVASAPDVDVAMKLGAGHPMGPIHLADYIGLDTVLSIIKGWAETHPQDGFVVPPSLEAMVAAGKLGRKSGEGFYKWDGVRVARRRSPLMEPAPLRLTRPPRLRVSARQDKLVA